MTEPSAAQTAPTPTSAPSASSSPPQDDCPDPTGPYSEYQVAAAEAQEQATRFTADVTVVEGHYKKLNGAQNRYQKAWTEQRDAVEDVGHRLGRVAEMLACVLKDDRRQQLADCWQTVKDETEPSTSTQDCTEIDGLSCDQLPDKEAELSRLSALSEVCVQQKDKTFDDLAGLPEGLAAKTKELADAVRKLEQDLSDSNSDASRAYVEYLRVHRKFSRLKADLTDATQYGCRLKALFVALLQTHRKAICMKVALKGATKRAELAEAARQDKVANLVDLVLECALRRPETGQSTAAGSQQQTPKAEAPADSNPVGAC